MSLTVEDGSIVSGADSYVTAANYITWADARYGSGRSTAPADADAAELLILRAMDYFESLSFNGYKSTQDQPRQWPRYDIWIDGYPIESNEIPNDVILSIYELTYAEEKGNGLFNTIDRATKSEKVGDLEVTYMDNASSRAMIPAAHAYIRKLVASQSRVMRV